MVAAHLRPNVGQRGRCGALGVVFAQHELFAVGRLHPLVVELQPRQLHADAGQQHGSKNRRHQRSPNQGLAHCAKEGQLRHLGRQHPQNGQKRDQGHDRAHETNAQTFHDLGESISIFLHALRSAFNMAHLVPICAVEISQRRAPSEHPMLDEKLQHHGNRHKNARNFCKHQHLPIELARGAAARFLQNPLDVVVKRAIPAVELHGKLNFVPGDSNDQCAAQPSPKPPLTVAKKGLKHSSAPCSKMRI